MDSFRIIATGIIMAGYLTVGAQISGKKSFPLDTSYTVSTQYEKYKNDFPYLVPARDELPPGVMEKRNLVYSIIEATPYGRRELHLDLFRPANDSVYPALMLIHGGGWRSDNKSLQVPMAQRIAQQGFVTIAVEYAVDFLKHTLK